MTLATRVIKAKGHYERPDPTRLENAEHVEKLIKSGAMERLAKNMWVFDRHKESAGGYITTVVERDKQGYMTFRVPTDKNGRIPELIMAERIMDMDDGDREGRERNVIIDLLIDADKKCGAKDLANTYRWYLYPNESDVKELDDAQSKLVQILSSKERPSGPKTIIITGGNALQREQMAEDIRNNFTIAEKKVIAGNLIEIRKLGRGIAGCFIAMSAFGRSYGIPRIQIDPEYVKDSEVIIHEAIHALRAEDKKREGPLKAVDTYIGKDVDLEEAMTEAETVARQRPFKKHKTGIGYYKHVRLKGKDTETAIKEDRITVTEPDLKKQKWDEAPKKGKRATKKVEQHFPEMNIAHLSIRGGVEAVDSFFKVKRPHKTLHIQVFSPEGGVAQARRLRASAKQLGHRVVEYRDGKRHVLKDVKPRKRGPGILRSGGRLQRQKRGSVI